MSSDVTSPAAPPFCNPDQPPERYREYPAAFDMVETQEQLAWWPLLRKALEVCEHEVLPAYERSDAEAIRHQDRHRLLAGSAALFGTVAVLLAISQLAFPESTRWLGIGDIPSIETVSALAALAAVVLGLMIALKARWLLEHHKAERLRLLKFRFLLDPAVWCDDERFPRHVERLRNAVDEIRRMTAHDFREWAEELGKLDIRRPQQSCSATDEGLRQLVDYYRAKRLVLQAPSTSRTARTATSRSPGSRAGWVRCSSS